MITVYEVHAGNLIGGTVPTAEPTMQQIADAVFYLPERHSRMKFLDIVAIDGYLDNNRAFVGIRETRRKVATVPNPTVK